MIFSSTKTVRLSFTVLGDCGSLCFIYFQGFLLFHSLITVEAFFCFGSYNLFFHSFLWKLFFHLLTQLSFIKSLMWKVCFAPTFIYSSPKLVYLVFFFSKLWMIIFYLRPQLFSISIVEALHFLPWTVILN